MIGSRVSLDENGRPIRSGSAISLGDAFQAIDFDTSAQSSAFGQYTRMIRIVASQPCLIEIGDDPVVIAAGFCIPAWVERYIPVQPGQRVAAAKVSGGSAGVLYIGEYEGHN